MSAAPPVLFIGALAHIDGDDAAAIIYTSGTTGVANGAVLTHNNFAANAVNLIAAWQMRADESIAAGATALSCAWAGERIALLVDGGFSVEAAAAV